MARGVALSDTLGHSLCKGCLRLFPLNAAAVVRGVVIPAAATLGLFPWGRAPTVEVGAPTRDAPECVSAVLLRVAEALAARVSQWAVWSYVRLHQHSQAAEFGDCTHFGHLRPPLHRYDEVGVKGRSLAGSWSRRPERSCVTPWIRMSRDSSSLRTTLSVMPLPRFFTRSRTQQSSGSMKVWRLTPSPPSRDHSVLTAALKPLVIDGTTTSFSAFSWAVRPPGQDAHNQARKERVSQTPEIKIGVYLDAFLLVSRCWSPGCG